MDFLDYNADFLDWYQLESSPSILFILYTMSLGARLPSSDPTPATTATLPERPRLHTSHPWPTPEQQQSIRSLLLVDDVHLLAGLDLLRSSTAQWTDHQLQALACLRSAPDDYIRDWLAVGRRLSGMKCQSHSRSPSTNMFF